LRAGEIELVRILALEGEADRPELQRRLSKSYLDFLGSSLWPVYGNDLTFHLFPTLQVYENELFSHLDVCGQADYCPAREHEQSVSLFAHSLRRSKATANQDRHL
jgi:hypothetical protein